MVQVRPGPVVMKFGGSSVADLERLGHVADLVAARAASQPVVAVVSAMGKATDALVAQAHALCPCPPRRELDMLLTTGERHSMALLSVALAARGVPAISLTGSQCGIITDHRHGEARVIEVRPFRISDELAAGHVVIIGGFQGVSYKREVTTLGRGGSDTTAVAVAAALGADCEIYSDVAGVFSADPREIPEARPIDRLEHGEMLALSRAGAKVLHGRAVELAARAGIAIYARATGQAGSETVIRANVAVGPAARAIAHDPGVVVYGITGAGSAQRDAFVRWACEVGLRWVRADAAAASGLFSPARRSDHVAVEREFSARFGGGGDGVPARVDGDLVAAIGAGVEDLPELGARAYSIARAHGLLAWYSEPTTLAALVPPGRGRSVSQAWHAALVARAADDPADGA